MADDGNDGTEGNEGLEELQVAHERPGDSGSMPRSREFDAMFLLGVTVLIVIFTLVIFWVKP